MSDNWELKPWQGIPQVSDAATVCRSELSVVDREEYDTMMDIVETLLATTDRAGKPLVANRCVFNCFKSVEK